MNIRNMFATVFSENRAFWQSGLDKQIFWQSGLLTIGLLTNGLSDNRAIWQQGGHHRVRTQNFAFSQSSNFWPHTWFFYRPISLKVLGYLINTLNRQRVDFEHDRTFFELLRFFYFREVSILRANIWRKLPKRVCTRRIHTANLWWNFSSKSVQPSSCYRVWRTNTRTDEQTH